METVGLSVFQQRFKDRRVLVTGHTGFKGSWLCEWLLQLGAQVCGYALPPLPDQTLFGQLKLAERISRHHLRDIRDVDEVRNCVDQFQPDCVFHLAAQPLVRDSYRRPLETASTNIMGTAHVLDAVRQLREPVTVIVVTTDKCYENREVDYSYHEQDRLGGHDVYSASKACAELLTDAWRRSFLSPAAGWRIASVRAGNVIGGGDWAADRIVPDIFRAVRAGNTVAVRNRYATRPWQHVLEPLSGYLWLAACLDDRADHDRTSAASAFNFGPRPESSRTVLELVQEVLQHVPADWQDETSEDAPHEAGLLKLSIEKADRVLNWQPVWNFATAVKKTAAWYMADASGTSATTLCGEQIQAYVQDAAQAGLEWTKGQTVG